MHARTAAYPRTANADAQGLFYGFVTDDGEPWLVLAISPDFPTRRAARKWARLWLQTH